MRWLFLLLGSLVLQGGAAAQPDRLDRSFERATAAYRQGQYARAVERYRGILDSGYASGALYYNLGNAYVRLDRLGPAIRYYEKARRLWPDDPRLRHNLEQARRRAGVYPERLGQGPPQTLADLVRGGSPLALFGVGGLLFGIGLVAAVFVGRLGAGNRERHLLAWGAVVGGLLLVGAALGISHVQSRHMRAVVVADTAALREAPNAEAVPDTTLPEGRLVEVRARREQWRRVRLADGTTGWVPAGALGDV